MEDQLKAILADEEQSHTAAPVESIESSDGAEDRDAEICQQKPVWNHPTSIGLDALFARFQAPYRGTQHATGPPTTNARPPPIFDDYGIRQLLTRNLLAVCWRNRMPVCQSRL